MKLHNKKTGEICELGHIRQAWREEKDGGMGYMFLKADDNNGIIYNSLAEMMDEWEDYKPAEPLIKEQEVRDVVKLWAKANLIPHNDNSIEYQLADALEGTFSEFWCNSLHIVFWSNVAPNAIHGKCYSIDELCGEED